MLHFLPGKFYGKNNVGKDGKFNIKGNHELNLKAEMIRVSAANTEFHCIYVFPFASVV